MSFYCKWDIPETIKLFIFAGFRYTEVPISNFAIDTSKYIQKGNYLMNAKHYLK